MARNTLSELGTAPSGDDVADGTHELLLQNSTTKTYYRIPVDQLEVGMLGSFTLTEATTENANYPGDGGSPDGETHLDSQPPYDRSFRMCFISDGRKSGEGAGSGTGVLAYTTSTTRGVTADWKRMSDKTTVVT